MPKAGLVAAKPTHGKSPRRGSISRRDGRYHVASSDDKAPVVVQHWKTELSFLNREELTHMKHHVYVRGSHLSNDSMQQRFLLERR